MSIQEFDIRNLNCANCASKIESGIQALPEVHSANLDFVNKKLIVQYHEAVDDPLLRLNKIAAAIEPGVSFSLTQNTMPVKKEYAFWIPLAMGAILAILGKFLSPALQPWVGIAAWLILGHRVLLSAVKSLFSKQVFSEQFLMGIATVGAIVLGEYLEAGAVMFLYEIGQWLEGRALEHSRKSIRRILAVKPEKAHLKTDIGTEDKRLPEIAVGDHILVYPGERVPLDGVIFKGESTVDTSTLTGEAEPLFVNEGTQIYAGFLNNSGLLEIEVGSVEAESTVSRILKLIENAGANKSTREKFITRFARIYTPVVVGLAFLVFLIPVLLGNPADVWFKRSLVFLIVSCPCALVISIPLTYYIGIGSAAKKGIIFKGSVYLDVLPKVDTMVFDKTGTLTTGDMEVDKIYVRDGGEPVELLDTLFLCEYASSHPFALAIRKAFSGEYDSRKVDAYSEYPGKGVLLQYGGEKLIAGSEAFLREFGFIDPIATEGNSAVHAARNDEYLGCVTFTDELKPGISQALAKLKKEGVNRTVMLSGDKRTKAEKVARELGLDEVYAELLPEHKLGRLEEIMGRSAGATAFVGDGMNDAPSLARADVGIAMGGIGNQTSIETADIVLLNDHPEQLAEAFRVSKDTGRVVVQNIVLALGIKVLVMALGLGGISGLWEAIIADVGVTLLVIFNSLRMLRYQRRA
jgi:Cd2+/Zn2+-exporting ATPase